MHHSAAVPHSSYYRIPPQARITGDFLQHRSRQDLDLKISTPASDPQNGSYRRGQHWGGDRDRAKPSYPHATTDWAPGEYEILRTQRLEKIYWINGITGPRDWIYGDWKEEWWPGI